MIRYEIEPSSKGIQRRLDAQGVDPMSPLRGAIQNAGGTQRALAYDGDRIVGGISFTPDRTLKDAHIVQMRVLDQHKGIGHGLLATVARSLPPGYSMVVTSALSSAIPFYVKTGGEHSNPNSHVVEWSPEAVDRLRGRTAGLNGDLPEGLTFVVKFRRDERIEEGMGLALGMLNGKEIAGLRWDAMSEPPVVLDITVDEEYQRRGIATAMFEWVKANHQSQLTHSDTLTSDGREWAQHTAMPSWRDRGVLPPAECVIAPDLGRSRRNSYLVYLYDQPFARRDTLEAAKASVEEIYGPVNWQRMEGDADAHPDHVWGWTTMFNDAEYYLIVERLPRLGVTAAKALPPGYTIRVEDGGLSQYWGLPVVQVGVWFEGRKVGGLGVHQRADPLRGIPNVWVDEAHQRKGLATAMYAEVKKHWPDVPIVHSEHASDAAKALNRTLAVTADVVDYKAERPLTGPDARPITSLMRGTSMVDFDKAPFADALDAAMGTDRHGDVPTYLAARKAWWKQQPVTQMSLSTPFVVTQANVNLPRVQQMIDHPETAGNEPIWMVRSGGRVYTLNGHHRLVAEHMKGSSTIAAKVIDASSLRGRTAAQYTIVGGDFHGITFDYDHIYKGSRNRVDYYMIREHGNIYSALTATGSQAGHLTVVVSMNEIGAVSVRREHQRQGIATEMLRMAREDWPGLTHTSVPGQLSPNGEAWAQTVGSRTSAYRPRSQVGLGHGPASVPLSARRGEVDPRPPRGPDVGPDHLGRDHHPRRDRGRAASQGARPRGVRPPVRVEADRKRPTVNHVDIGGPLALAFPKYSPERQREIFGALKAFREGRVRPDAKDPSRELRGCYTIPTGGTLTTAEPDRLVLVKTKEGKWLAVYAVVNHNYGPASQHVPAWLASQHAKHVRLGARTAGWQPFQPPAHIKITTGGDAVPGGYNGYYVAWDKATGEKMGYLDYQSASWSDVVEGVRLSGSDVKIAMVEVEPKWRRKGVASVLLDALRHDFPTDEIDPGYTTPDGSAWWNRVRGGVASATGMPDNGVVTESAKSIPMGNDITNPLWDGNGIYEMDISRWSSTRCVALLTSFPGMGVFPIGWLTWDTERHTIEGIFVNEDYRGKGVGVEMKKAAERAAGYSLDNDSGEYTAEGLAWAKKHGIPKAKNSHPVSVSDMARMRGQMNNLLMGSDDLITAVLLKMN